jgi:hypothetical protein
MRIFVLAACLSAAVATATIAVAANDHRAPLVFAEHGFSIEPPVGHDKSQLQKIVTMSLPMSDNFTPNVNVITQPFPGTLEQYLDQSHGEFKARGLVLMNEKRDERSATIEYRGDIQGHAVHWYARVLLAKGTVTLATATSVESQWPALGETLRRSVDSLQPLP